MPLVQIRENEPVEISLRRFKRYCEKAGIISECRRREFYEKPTWKRKRLKAQAVKRWSKKQSRSRYFPARSKKKTVSGSMTSRTNYE